MKLPSRAARKLGWTITGERNRVARRKGLRRLREQEEPLRQTLADVLVATQQRRTAPEEQIWIERIEGLRKRLAASDAIVEARLAEYTGDEADAHEVRVHTMSNLAHQKAQPLLWGLLLFRLIREFRPATCLELGTGLGISTAYEAAAVALNGHGRLITLEAAASRVELARRNFDELGLEEIDVRRGRFHETLEGALHDLGRVDFAFVDGHHAERATIGYFDRIATYLSDPGVVVFDDIRWSDGMARAWNVVRSDERVAVSVDLGRAGVCVRKDGAARGAFAFPLR